MRQTIDPASWSDRLQGLALVVAILSWLAACLVPHARVAPSDLWVVMGLGAVGALSWRFEAVPWRDIASWTLPLTVWVAIVVIVDPTPLVGALGFMIGGGWLGLFACWSPFAQWWYRAALRKPYPFASD